MPHSEDTTQDEAAIRALIDAFVKAIRARDIEAVMSVFGSQVVSFDLGPPLQHGQEDFRQRWQAMFDAHSDPVDYEITDLGIAVGGDIAFSHSLNRNGGHWVRWTACYRRIDGWWRIVHEHVSVPVDAREGKAVPELRP